MALLGHLKTLKRNDVKDRGSEERWLCSIRAQRLLHTCGRSKITFRPVIYLNIYHEHSTLKAIYLFTNLISKTISAQTGSKQLSTK